MTGRAYETEDGEPAEPNEFELALSWLFSSDGTIDYQDGPWKVNADGQDGRYEFHDEENDTTAYLPRGSSGDITGGGSSTDEVIRTRQANIPMTEIADTNTAVGLRKQIPSGKTLRILEVGVEDDTGAAPTGLTVEARDLTNATNVVSQNSRHTEGSPIASKAGAIDVTFRINNDTGGSVNASGYVLYTME